MTKIGLWQIPPEGAPHKLATNEVALERHIENWIEADPSLLGAGLTIVGRQINIPGGRLDLLAIDPQGRLVLIEIKPGTLRRETIGQVLDYASSLEVMPFQELQDKLCAYLQTQNTTLVERLESNGHTLDILRERPEIVMYVVGVGNLVSLERMVNYLSGKFNLPINAVVFDVFELPDGSLILSRQMTSADIEIESASESVVSTVSDLLQKARENGIGDPFEVLYNTALQMGFYPRPYKKSIMYTPPRNRTRYLYTAWTDPKNSLLRVYVGPSAIAEFYPVSEKEAITALGEDGWRLMNLNDAQIFAQRLTELLLSSELEDQHQDEK